MKRFFQRGLLLCLASLFVVGLLMVPVSADEEPESGESIISTMDPDTKCVTAGGWTWDLSLLDEVTKDMSQEEKALVEMAIESTIRMWMDEKQWAQEDLQEADGAAVQANGPCGDPDHPK